MLDDKVLSRGDARDDLLVVGLRPTRRLARVVRSYSAVPRYTAEDETILVGLGFPPHVKE